MSTYHLPLSILDTTFAFLRECGRGRHECQVLWLSPWSSPGTITEVVHPKHRAHLDGFVLDDKWISDFWLRLAREKLGIRVQVHTHPHEAFHSLTDDRFPIIHTPGFLSLVFPDFGLREVGFEDAYLTEIQSNGRWQETAISTRLIVK
jgi:hypothetical protein